MSWQHRGGGGGLWAWSVLGLLLGFAGTTEALGEE